MWHSQKMRVINTEDGRKILLPSNDYIFKLIFGDERNKHILAAFLAAVLQMPKDELVDLTLMNTELLPEAGDDKLGIMDILLRACSKTHARQSCGVFGRAFSPQSLAKQPVWLRFAASNRIPNT
jgi:hypothetical protein